MLKKLFLLSLTFTIISSSFSQTLNSNAMTNSKTVVFIHGLFVTNQSWNEWKSYFETQGYTCYAPAYPLKDDSAQNLRKNIATGKIETLHLDSIIKQYEDFLKKLGGKPILIGHSLGGLLVQILVNKGYVSAGICIHSGPPKGVFSFKWSFLKSNLPLLLASKKKPYLMPFKNWQYAFTNGMSLEEQKASYEKSLCPESAIIAKEATTSITKIDFKKAHVPLLFINGSIDHIIPTSLSKTNIKKYTDANSVVDFKEFEGRNHYTCNAPGWEEVATYINKWIINLK
jgi:pimeloyl-ACP methyl ester carboxylesterase